MEKVNEKRTSTQNFIGGALILSLGGLLAKILGALYRIPLTNIVGSYGMAVSAGVSALHFVSYGGAGRRAGCSQQTYCRVQSTLSAGQRTQSFCLCNGVADVVRAGFGGTYGGFVARNRFGAR